mgnify:CR=1 FL=1
MNFLFIQEKTRRRRTQSGRRDDDASDPRAHAIHFRLSLRPVVWRFAFVKSIFWGRAGIKRPCAAGREGTGDRGEPEAVDLEQSRVGAFIDRPVVDPRNTERNQAAHDPAGLSKAA